MTNLFDPPQLFDLPVSKGGDLYFVFKYKELVVDEDGEPVLDEAGQKSYAVADYPDGATAQLVIETDDPTTPIVVDADIAGPLATFLEDKAVADTVKAKKLWRVVLAYTDGMDRVLCNGLTVRSDGKVPK